MTVGCWHPFSIVWLHYLDCGLSKSACRESLSSVCFWNSNTSTKSKKIFGQHCNSSTCHGFQSIFVSEYFWVGGILPGDVGSRLLAVIWRPRAGYYDRHKYRRLVSSSTQGLPFHRFVLFESIRLPQADQRFDLHYIYYPTYMTETKSLRKSMNGAVPYWAHSFSRICLRVFMTWWSKHWSHTSLVLQSSWPCHAAPSLRVIYHQHLRHHFQVNSQNKSSESVSKWSDYY